MSPPEYMQDDILRLLKKMSGILQTIDSVESRQQTLLECLALRFLLSETPRSTRFSVRLYWYRFENIFWRVHERLVCLYIYRSNMDL